MSVNINAMDLVFGLHSSSSPAFKDYRESDKTMRYLFNGFSTIGWVPLVGVIAGIARLIFTAIMHKNDLQSEGMNPEARAFYTVMVLRGVLETLSLGFLLLIPDLILTIGREIAFSVPKEMPHHQYEHANKYSSVISHVVPKEDQYNTPQHSPLKSYSHSYYQSQSTISY